MSSCVFCNNQIVKKSWEKKVFCNRSCSAAYNNKLRIRSVESKSKTSQKLKEYNSKNPKPVITRTRKCVICSNEFVYKHSGRRACNSECSTKLKTINARKGGIATSSLPFHIRCRSRNEKYFADLIHQRFPQTITNKRIFDGYDADIIIQDLKIAIHWNGPFHYRIIFTAEHFSKIVSRDILRYEAIQNAGFINYIIDDRHNQGFDKQKVQDEFDSFIVWLDGR